MLNTKVTYIWLLLAFLTSVSWALGDGYAAGENNTHVYITVALLVLAFFKIRLIIMYFMEIQTAPVLMRALFEAWVVIVCSTLIFLYLGLGV